MIENPYETTGTDLERPPDTASGFIGLRWIIASVVSLIPAASIAYSRWDQLLSGESIFGDEFDEFDAPLLVAVLLSLGLAATSLLLFAKCRNVAKASKQKQDDHVQDE